MRFICAVFTVMLALDASAKSRRDDLRVPQVSEPRSLGCYYADELYEQKYFSPHLWRSFSRYMVRPTAALPTEAREELFQFLDDRRSTEVACLEGLYVPLDEWFLVLGVTIKSQGQLTAEDVANTRWVCDQPPYLFFAPRLCRGS